MSSDWLEIEKVMISLIQNIVQLPGFSAAMLPHQEKPNQANMYHDVWFPMSCMPANDYEMRPVCSSRSLKPKFNLGGVPVTYRGKIWVPN